MQASRVQGQGVYPKEIRPFESSYKVVTQLFDELKGHEKMGIEYWVHYKH